MHQDDLASGIDLQKMMQAVAQVNPHVSLAYIAYLLDVPCDDDLADYTVVMGEEVCV